MTDSPPRFPFPSGAAGEPSTEYKGLREDEPISEVSCPIGDPVRLVCRHADVTAVMSDPRFSRRLYYPGAPRFTAARDVSSDPESILNMDPPEHTRIRRFLQHAVSARNVRSWRRHIQRTTDHLLDALAARGGSADLVTDFAEPLPNLVMCALVGAPAKDCTQWQEWSNMTVSLTKYSVDEVRAGLKAFERYVADLVRSNAATGDGELISSLREAHIDGEGLAEHRIVRSVRGLIFAAYETTSSAIAHGAALLLAHPEQRAALRTHPELIGPAVEEILRYWPPFAHGVPRRATEDIKLSGGCVLAGQAVIGPIAAANRDERAFTDPDTFDIRRHPNPHLSFGQGAHYCVGAALARSELEVALSSLLARFPDLALSCSLEGLRWHEGFLVRRLESLPVTW
ncbi:cytochrome P450 [Streptomyces ochraceiscleroticus]|uniref:Cytochrome P450 n=1 Tax=Streptomyces ochraceiscleroticus TaxID=47761 RepID=A0ABW1MM67_9ACTN|nr:cytochrome P450 [Streptomyces ochraceiscleroticus]